MCSIRIASFYRSLLRGLLARLIIGLLLAGCAPTIAPTQPPRTDEVVLYNWDGDIPQSVLDAFTQETNIKVNYQTYESQEEAIANLRAGKTYDVVIMDSRFIPLLTDTGLLAKLNYEHVVNFKNISPNFRGLAYDPGNEYSIPYSWGTTELLVRTDLVPAPVTQWADLWDPRYAHRVALWRGQPRETLALTLKSLGFSANSEKPAELEAALAKLLVLRPTLQFMEDYDPQSAAVAMASGKVALAMGYSGDFLDSQEKGLPLEYIAPGEGILLWGDTFVVPASSPHREAAEQIINFLLRPEISAAIANRKYYAPANEAALALIDPKLLDNPAIFPSQDTLRKAEIILPLSPAGQQLYDQVWQKFLEADPQ